MKLLLVLCVCFALLSSGLVLAGEYNFYFNNLGQGNDSKAAPEILVIGDKGVE